MQQETVQKVSKGFVVVVIMLKHNNLKVLYYTCSHNFVLGGLL